MRAGGMRGGVCVGVGVGRRIDVQTVRQHAVSNYNIHGDNLTEIWPKTKKIELNVRETRIGR